MEFGTKQFWFGEPLDDGLTLDWHGMGTGEAMTWTASTDDPDLAGWRMGIGLHLNEGDVTVGPVVSWPAEPSAGGRLTSEAARKALGRLYSQVEDEYDHKVLRGLSGRQWEAATLRLSKRGKQRSGIHLAKWAQLYVEALEVAPNRPAAHLAETLSVAAKTVRNVIYECREQGYLTGVPENARQGGELTDKARRELNR